MKENKQSNHLSDEQIALYVDALRLDKVDELPAELIVHIDACKPCHRAAIDLYSVLGEVSYDDLGAHPTLDKKTAKVFSMNRMLMRAAAAVILLVAAFYFYNRSADVTGPGDIVNETPEDQKIKLIDTPDRDFETSPPPKEEIAVEDAPVKIAPPKKEIPQRKAPANIEPPGNRELFAANFTPSEEWEDLVGESVRSGELKIIHPENTYKAGLNKPINFKWEGSSMERYIVVLDNRGEEVQQAKVLSNTIDLDLNLSPGLYYWKLESADDLLHVGKFEVK